MVQWPYAVALLTWVLLHHCCATTTETTESITLPIKELTEPRKLPAGNALYQQSLGPSEVAPAKPAICPDHLVKGLRGWCFTLATGHYEFRVCPFHNVTQRDTTYQMLTIFHGIIGVWDGWYIENGSFVAMSMRSGEPCLAGAGGVQRETVVRLACANSTATSLVSVQEHPVCRYNMLLVTPLVCHPQAMLVYPCLAASERLARYQRAWDALYTLRHSGLINDSSYNILLDQLLFEAQLLVDTRAGTGSSDELVGAPVTADKGAKTTPSAQLDLSNARHKGLSMDFIAGQIRTLQAQIEQHSVGGGGGGSSVVENSRAQFPKP